jgi:hypothetical protein
MKSDTLDTYNDFVHAMWSNNCSERDAYGEPMLAKDEYVKHNESFLLDEFWVSWGRNRKWIDGEYKTDATGV